ncbi:proton glutamate symport protein [Enterococcus sp. PF1-24]|uniref:dicarboxylate/amino acid:cation symporter n=1 Tax=unclassified Enterococcus TaxID=2608891 RepID=UPI0024738775|nr:MULTISPECIES: dicarboxylate/amino acid:cation symporter [unclassified Enterococcus]MDH6363526.1 proton glutamate symport protein [Enterococcus sp. PFB1-1]MDH6400620.1 proton glutamate symport protein [Enterococcus sp. PF1-24]
MKKISLTKQIILAVALGIVLGIIFPSFSQKLEVVGTIFLRLMQMAIPLLVMGQIIQAVGGIRLKELTNLGGRTILVFGTSSILAAAWGILFAKLFQPGNGVASGEIAGNAVSAQTISIHETLVGFFPNNIFAALSEGSIVQIIIFSIFFGLALSKYQESHPESLFSKFLDEFNELVLNVIRFVMVFAPIGIAALISSTISTLGLSIVLPLLKYLLVYAVATFSFIALWALVISIYCRVSLLQLIRNTREMSIMALATTSSAVTLPTALAESRNKIGLSERVANLVLTLGMSLNSNGSAMHMAITVVTIAQLYQIEFSIENCLYLSVLATFVSLANAVVPGAGLVSLAIIVPQMGLPVESIAVFAGVEWFVGMLRTILNVNSDVFSAIIVGKSVNELDYQIFNKK